MKKYFVSFVIEAEEGKKDIFRSDIVDFGEIQYIQQIRKLEEYLLEQWGDSNEEDVTIINYREV